MLKIATSKYSDLSHYIYCKNHQYGVLMESFLLLPSVSSILHPQDLKGEELEAFYPC